MAVAALVPARSLLPVRRLDPGRQLPRPPAALRARPHLLPARRPAGPQPRGPRGPRGLRPPAGASGTVPAVRSLNPGTDSGTAARLAGVTVAREEDLYEPVKAFLDGQGYAVKAEIRGCDLVARRGEEPPVIVELKQAFQLALLLQGVDRLARSEEHTSELQSLMRLSYAVFCLQ